MDSSTVLGAVAVNAAGVATYATAALTPGTHSITAVYGGDSNNAGSTSSVLTQSVDAPAALTTPAPGSTLGTTNVVFSWTTGTGVADYKFLLGTTGVGSSNLYSSGTLTTTSATVASIPANGATVYAQLYSKINGTWVFTNYTYTEASSSSTPAVLTTPASGSALGTTSVVFDWTAGTGVTSYQLLLGTTGVGSSNLYSSGTLTTLTTTVASIPANGATVYAELSSLISGVWQSNNYTYTESLPAAISTPTPGSTLGTTNVAFSWTAGTGVSGYQLLLGTTGVGSSNLYSSGTLTTTTATVASIPANGVTVYAQLSSLISGVWQASNYTYIETASSSGPAVLTSPTPGSTLGTTNVVFSWTMGTGVADYRFWLGTTGVGSSNLYNSGTITATSATVASIPANGVTVYARLYSKIAGVWQSNDYTYIEASSSTTPAALTSPAAGSALGTNNVVFNWTAGTGVTGYQLLLGTTGVGSSNLYSSGTLTTLTATVATIPANGVTVYVQLSSLISGVWQANNYTFSESLPAAISTPAPSSTLGTTNVAFSWSAGIGVTGYQLLLGTTGVGSSNLYSSGTLTTTTATVASIPANGVTVYAQLNSLIGGVWQSANYTYTEAASSGTPATITSPTPGSTLGTTSVVFTWTAGTGVSDYRLFLGTTGVGSLNLYNSGTLTTTSTTVPSIPANGVTVYAQLLSKIAGVWVAQNYTYTEQ